MSKKQLVGFLDQLEPVELREQVLDLYQRFKNVKEFYDFSFNPKEDKAFELAKQKISKEYFPDNNRRAKKRRSIAQKQIIHLQKLETSPSRIADLMLFNIEIAQAYRAENQINQFAFYKSMLTSFRNALIFIKREFLIADYEDRIHRIIMLAQEQEWENQEGFVKSLELLKD